MQHIGTQSIKFQNPPYIQSWASVVSKKEGEGPLKLLFDEIEEDDYFGCKTWEEAESQLQKRTVDCLLKKGKINQNKIQYIFAGDLLGQTIASTFGMMDYQIPLFGLYGACSTAGESLSLAAMTVAGDYADNVIAVTSSHFASAERQFRYPLEYAGQRPLSATWTVTGSGAFIVSSESADVKITGITTGTVVDYGVKDSMNMGAAMAPAAADLIAAHLKDFDALPTQYSKIITGDLGEVGSKLLIDLLHEKGIDISDRHMDCGTTIYDTCTQEVGSGGSGCGCAAVTLAADILPRLASGEYGKVLFVPTGALLSTISFNEGMTVPGIAHGVLLESSKY